VEIVEREVKKVEQKLSCRMGGGVGESGVDGRYRVGRSSTVERGSEVRREAEESR
jgi:hypothetical protein